MDRRTFLKAASVASLAAGLPAAVTLASPASPSTVCPDEKPVDEPKARYTWDDWLNDKRAEEQDRTIFNQELESRENCNFLQILTEHGFTFCANQVKVSIVENTRQFQSVTGSLRIRNAIAIHLDYSFPTELQVWNALRTSSNAVLAQPLAQPLMLRYAPRRDSNAPVRSTREFKQYVLHDCVLAHITCVRDEDALHPACVDIDFSFERLEVEPVFSWSVFSHTRSLRLAAWRPHGPGDWKVLKFKDGRMICLTVNRAANNLWRCAAYDIDKKSSQNLVYLEHADPQRVIELTVESLAMTYGKDGLLDCKV
jgi:hypothetical protein